MFGYWVWVHFDVRKPSCVTLKMNLEISFRCESVATDITFKGSLSSVGPDMNLESRVAAKHLAAVSAAVLVIRILGVIGSVVVN